MIGVMLAATLYALVLVRWPSLAAHVPAMLMGFVISAGGGALVGVLLSVP
jgi:hypothetical protein